jgi:hypothetical protein
MQTAKKEERIMKFLARMCVFAAVILFFVAVGIVLAGRDGGNAWQETVESVQEIGDRSIKFSKEDAWPWISERVRELPEHLQDLTEKARTDELLIPSEPSKER